MPFYKVTEREADDAARWDKAKATFERRIDFWRDFLSEPEPGFTLAFVSHYARATAEQAVGFPIRNSVVLPSPINTDLYAFEPKSPEQRFEILSVRPFSDWRYANDLSVAAILQLRDHPRFADMHFRFVGTGHLFERTLLPIRDLPNVTCEESFVPQQEIARLHRGAGIFLCPTRDDAQGVARDEAMSSGLVVATNRVAAIPEFADDDSAILAPPEDASALAEGIARLVDDPSEFERRSRNAAMRIRATIAMDLVIPRELELLAASST
nr:glycosyltransferase family 4 protein [Sphingomicrobium nitratireducens]